MMDLLALACQEVGLDMSEEVHEEKENSCDSQEWIMQPPEVEQCQNAWPLHYKEELVKPPDSEIILENHVPVNESYNMAVFTLSGSHTASSSPVTNLYSQRKTNQLSRSRSWKAYEGIQGVPCRNLPDLVTKPRARKVNGVESFHLEVSPSSSPNKDPLDASNPFLQLFRDNNPGQVAFAFYVADCWFSFFDSNILPDHDQFLTQCTRWWVTLPTPYKRGYWTKEMQYKKKMGIGLESKAKSPKRKKEKSKNFSKNASLENGIVESEMSPPKKMKEAFMSFVKMNIANVTKELPGASGGKIKQELSRRWISLSQGEKEKFVEERKHADVISEKKNGQEFVTCPTSIKSEGKYDSKDEIISSIFNQEINEFMTGDENIEKEVNVKQNETQNPTVEISVEDIEKFAINANYYIEEDSFNVLVN